MLWHAHQCMVRGWSANFTSPGPSAPVPLGAVLMAQSFALPAGTVTFLSADVDGTARGGRRWWGGAAPR